MTISILELRVGEAAAYELIVQDLEEVDLSRPQMTVKLIVNLE
tara:strand:+ start:295 stop:423 length:129 start_codon:yes stop_codon:yes gene_type:complete